MQTASLFARDDTFLGVCEALGQDFGINPLFLRLAFAVAVMWQPLWVVAAYLGLGLAVLASRLLFPAPRAEAPPAEAAAEAPANDAERVELAEAA